ncbi:MAG: hypothetical protein U0R78_09725 [Nocardioidaceae bacterium]
MADADLTAVTRDGDVLGAHFASGGSSAQPSLIEIQAAVDEATEQLAAAVASTERLAFETSGLEAARLEAQKRVDVALARPRVRCDARRRGRGARHYGSQARSARAEADRLAQGRRRGARGGPHP